MKKSIKRFSVLMIVVLVISIVAATLVACDKKPKSNNKIYDSEERPFSMSISEPDEVFNPFFSSSAYDSSIISLTQISMLSNDNDGKIICGDNEPTVTKDYTIKEAEDGSKTSYEFLIKNGIKWSNGTDLTIRDVLFNLYVYLDPAYTGSATIYSTDIVGLSKYRLQSDRDTNDDPDAMSDFEAGFIREAAQRINDLINYVKYYSKYTPEKDKPSLPQVDGNKIASDFAVFARLFMDELNSDWNAINIEDYKDWGLIDPATKDLPAKDQKFDGINDKWLIFFLNDGGYTTLLKLDKDNNFAENEKGNFIVDETAREELLYTMAEEWLVGKGLATIDEETFEVTLNTADEKELDAAIKEYCINTVFSDYFPGFFDNDANKDIVTRDVDKFVLTQQEISAIITGLIPQTNASNFENVALYWGSASTALSQFTAEQKSIYFSDPTKRIVPNIEGITVRKTTSFNGKSLGQSHYVLCIDINDVDPKAIYNFSFTVSPMYWYSTTNWNDGTSNRNYIQEMADDFADWEAAYDRGESYSMSHFGLEFGSSNFMTEVVKASSRIGVPVGGGPYMASSATGKESGVTKTDFFNNNMIYYVRNPYFNTVGAELENAKIKYIRYKVVNSDQIVNYLTTKNIDFGDPSATQQNEDVLKASGIETVRSKTNGYGYVGINPRFVPSIEVRRIIMTAMNTQLIVDDYYEGGWGEVIKRPISKTSWAYPESANDFEIDGFSYSFNESNNYNGQRIEDILENLGYEKRSGVYQKMYGNIVDRLDYKFTIAGGSTDHPAYAMFLQAAEYLNKHGFGVQVVTSQKALSDLSSGKLAVWAAAWSSTIDPDMYQIYHEESQASSVKNWGYPQILGATNDAAWGDELEIIHELSKLIDLGRATTNQKRRENVYASALDKVMELAVEFPTYQRYDMSAYQNGLLDPKTLPAKDFNFKYTGLLTRIWEIDYL